VTQPRDMKEVILAGSCQLVFIHIEYRIDSYANQFKLETLMNTSF